MLSSAQPPPFKPPITPVTVDPSIHGAPDRPSTNSAQSSAGKPLVGAAVAVRHPSGPPPTPIPEPVTVTIVPGFGDGPSLRPPPACASTDQPVCRLTRAIAKSASGS